MQFRMMGLAAMLALAVGCAGTAENKGDAGAGGGGGQGGAGGTGGTGNTGGGGAGGGVGGAGGSMQRNARPELARIGDREAPAESELSIQLMATDPEGASLSYNVRSRLPDGAKFEKGAGLFTWTPRADQEGLIALITFEVSDGELKDQETIQVTVVQPGPAVNRAPEIDEIGDQVVTATQPFDLQIRASDPNGDALTYALRGDMLEGASLGADTGLFTWTPPEALVGQSFNVEFVVSDGTAETTAAVKFVVRESGNVNPGNLPPVIVDIPPAELTVGERFEYQLQVEDDDPGSLTYLLAGEPPAGAALSNTGLFSWTPVPEQAGQAIRVIFRVSDGEFTAVKRATFQVVGRDDPMMNMCTPDAQGDAPFDVIAGANLNRTICPADNVDKFRFAAQANDRIQIDVTFAHADGDIDVRLRRVDGERVAVAASADDNEQIVYVAAEDGDYQIEVYGYREDATPDYTLALAIEAGVMQCMDDGFEGGVGNDTRDNAVPIDGAVGRELVICGDDEDWYSVELQAGVDIAVTLTFSHADGDIDARLLDPDGTRVSSGLSGDDNESFTYQAQATGTHLLHVYGYELERNAYTLAVDVGEPVDCDPDRVEPNDTHANAEPFRPELYRNLTFCGDEDWYKTDVPDGQNLQVFISYDGAQAADMEASTPGMIAVPGQTFEVGMGDGCRADRAGCRLLTVPGRVGGGFLHYEVRGLAIGSSYDLTVRTVDAIAPGACNADNVTCEDIQICDYDANDCVDAFCDAGACPNGYGCHQDWCTEGCLAGACRHPLQVCKHLDGAFRCGIPGDEPIGGACNDFTDCAGDFDCLVAANIPGGYCSRECTTDNDCGAGAVCTRFGDGAQLCAKTCLFNDDCRDGYGCNLEARVEGDRRTVCTPGIEI